MRFPDRDALLGYGPFLLVVAGFLYGNSSFDFLGISGFRLPTWLTIGLAVVLFLGANRNGERALPFRAPLAFWFFYVIFLIWQSALALSVLWSPFSGEVGSQLEGFFLTALGVLIASLAWFEMSENRRKRSLLLFATSVLLLVPFALWEGFDRFGRITPSGAGPITYGRALSFALIILIFFSLFRKDNRWVALGSFATISIVLAGSRGVNLALVVALIFFVTLVFQQRWRTISELFRFFSPVLLCWLGLIWATLFPLSSWGLGNKSPALDSYVLRPLTSATGREELFRGAWNSFLESPLVGNGLNSFRMESISPIFPEGAYAHNLILSSLAEGGLLATVPLLVTLVTLVLHGLRTTLVEYSVLFATLLLFIFLQSMVSGDYYDARFFWLFACLFMLSNGRQTQEKSPISK